MANIVMQGLTTTLRNTRICGREELNDLVDTEIWFVFSLQLKGDATPAKPGGEIQLHDQICQVIVEGVPRSKFVDNLPSSDVLWQAESMFLEKQREQFSDRWVIAWEARYSGSGGVALSRFRVLLPANED